MLVKSRKTAALVGTLFSLCGDLDVLLNAELHGLDVEVQEPLNADRKVEGKEGLCKSLLEVSGNVCANDPPHCRCDAGGKKRR